ncbi:Sn1-specific diacylglycerol lipase beta [Armadillidium nasatum]|uniref:Sn1-specific diacylglycerol lipase beta n=2 Tax=Armadillidium nasatum TaxID=96803 RepID=A0A5N5T6V5_9CRUS|nr:Sn1-specific diacylglycerol lipase beta [Armadillidium nasatum]
MPSLVVFGRRWRIGSDDFVFPGIFEAVVRAAWLILTLVLFYEHIRDSEKIDPDGTSCKKGETLIRIYVIGVLVILSLSFLLSVTLAIHSAKGTIMTTAPRRYVPQILIFRVVFGVFEIGWNILGTLWLYSDQVQCEKSSAIWVLLEG